ncbi:MAG: Lrp/AsnC family transcriptional regulator [Gammaproteobacteria bacterium]|nr:Lrp/AsnC family transcriptional regulator [Gammaproteobacteria bacterium]
MVPEPTGHHDKQHTRVELIQQLLNEYQHDFPLTATPYADMARHLGISEDHLLDILKELKEQNILSRVGAVFRPNRVGASTLAAMAVPEHRLEEVAEIISSYSAVNHNYEREHHFNLWFVATAENAELLDAILEDMEQQTQIRILSLPMEKDYHIDLGFPLQLIHGGQDD